MTALKICNDTVGTQAVKTLTDIDAIATELHGVGVRIERWKANKTLTNDMSNDDIIAAYRESVDRLMNEYGFKSVDVVALTPEHPQKAEFRKKFLEEHQHSDFEVRFFVEGKGLFYLHPNDKVYCLMCEKGDLISVPANMKHWFDMGENPNFKCIRLFTTPEGWVAQFTGDPIAKSFPAFDQF